VAPAAGADRSKDDSLVEVGGGRWLGHRRQKSDQSRRAPKLGRAGDTAAKVFSQKSATGWRQLIKLISVDQRARSVAGQHLMRLRRVHTLYMTRTC
jgi:hypothetical protein